jgi:hypothetical protein
MVDDRLRNIREGAGKEDNRYSELMTDLLDKVGPYIVGAVILGSGGYLAYKWYDNKKSAALSAAFFELEQAITSGSPTSLEAVAREHAGQHGVAYLAELELGEVYLSAARKGVAPGATLTPEGAPEHPEDLLTPEQVTQYLTKSSTAFQFAYDATKGDPVQALPAVKALFGLAAVAESRGDVEGATRQYTEAGDRAKAAGFDALEALAAKRKQSVASLGTVAVLYKAADLPPRIEPAPPFPTTPGPTTGSSPINVAPGVTATKVSGPPGTGPTPESVGPPAPEGGASGPPSPGISPGATPPAPPSSPTPAANPAPSPGATPPAGPAGGEPSKEPKR